MMTDIKMLQTLVNLSPADAARLGKPLVDLRDEYKEYQRTLFDARRTWGRNAAPEASIHDYENLRVADVRIAGATGGRNEFRRAVDREGPAGPTFAKFQAAARTLATENESQNYFIDQFDKLSTAAAKRVAADAKKVREAVQGGLKPILAVSGALGDVERLEAVKEWLSGGDMKLGGDSTVTQVEAALRNAVRVIRDHLGFDVEVTETDDEREARAKADRERLDNLVTRANQPVTSPNKLTEAEFAELFDRFDELAEWQQIAVKHAAAKHSNGLSRLLKNAANPAFDSKTNTVRAGVVR